MNDLIKRTDAIKHFEAKADYYRQRLAKIKAQGDAISYDPTDQIKGFEEKIAIYEDAVKEIKEISAAEPCEDTISRAFILGELSDLADEFSEVDENGLHSERWCGIMDSKGVIKNAPSVVVRKNRTTTEPQTYITEDRDTQILDAWQVHHRNITTVEDEPTTEQSSMVGGRKDDD